MPDLYIDKFQWLKPGFRTRIRSGWFVFRRGRTFPVAGPFVARGDAITERNVMAKREKEKETADPADPDDAEETDDTDDDADETGEESSGDED